ncbi:MAG: MBL fold metallo-hydrolase [Fodinibius sp.]|nr:MBL fold metallo-hydrolase [Fodinibius sp.]
MGENDQDLAITFWGVRGSTPCANKENMKFGGNTSCLQIHLPDNTETLILDSGTGIRNLGNKLQEHSGDINGHIFITHPHWDHIQGFPFFKPIYESNNRFVIHMPEQANGQSCRDILSGHLTKTFFPVTLDMIDANLEYATETGQRTSYAGYDIEFIYANHTINTAIYKVHIGGKEIVYCPDNEINISGEPPRPGFNKELTAFFEDIDLLIHDGQYNLQSYQDKCGWGHSPWEHVIDFARACGVPRLFITHHDPDSTDDYLTKLDNQISRQFGDDFKTVQLAREGDTISI